MGLGRGLEWGHRSEDGGSGLFQGPGGEYAFPLGAVDNHYSRAVRRSHSPLRSSLWEELSDRPRQRDMLQNDWTGLLKNAKVMTGEYRPNEREIKNVPS